MAKKKVSELPREVLEEIVGKLVSKFEVGADKVGPVANWDYHDLGDLVFNLLDEHGLLFDLLTGLPIRKKGSSNG